MRLNVILFLFGILLKWGTLIIYTGVAERVFDQFYIKIVPIFEIPTI